MDVEESSLTVMRWMKEEQRSQNNDGTYLMVIAKKIGKKNIETTTMINDNGYNGRDGDV